MKEDKKVVDAVNFNEDMIKVEKLLNGYGEELTEWQYDCLYSTKEDKFVYDAEMFGDFLYDMVNHDLVSLSSPSRIDIDNSNHHELAEVLSKYATDENIAVCYMNLY